MYSTMRADYSPILRGKPGEFDALGRLFAPIKDMILPTIVVPSLSKRDTEKRKVLTPQEAIHLHAGRIAVAWPTRPLLLDTRFLKLSADEAEDAKILARFFDLIEQANCLAIPTAGLRTTSKHKTVFRGYHERRSSGVALRVILSDIDHHDLDVRLTALAKELGASPKDTVVLIDFGDADLVAVDAFSELLANSYDKVAEIAPWARIVMAASNYPAQNPARENATASVPRHEWAAWKKAASADDRIKKSIFGDFGADSGKIIFMNGGGIPHSHFRYAVQDSWFVSRGGPTSSVIDGSIRGAALRIAGSKFFAGETFSWGDQFISDCANNLGNPGTPSTWRAANMNHHITRALTDLGGFIGHQVAVSSQRYSPVQTALAL